MATFEAAAALADWNKPGFAADLVDLAGDDVWPIVSPTFILLPTNPMADRVAASRNTMRFFDWAMRTQADAARRLEYLPLPAPVQALVRASWSAVKDPSGAAIGFQG